MEQAASIFLEAFGAAQLVPLSTHATWFALRGFGAEGLWPLALCAVLGGALGQMVNWTIGRALLWLQLQGKLNMPEPLHAAGCYYFRRYFWPVLLFSWFGLGGLLVLAAGFLRLRWWQAFMLVLAGYVGFFGFYLLH